MMMRLPTELKVRRPLSGKVRIPFMRMCGIVDPAGEQAGLICDLSEGGVYVRLQRRLAPGTRVRVWFELFTGDAPLVLQADVMWQNLEDQRRVPVLPPGCGLSFLPGQDTSALSALVKSYTSPLVSS